MSASNKSNNSDSEDASTDSDPDVDFDTAYQAAEPVIETKDNLRRGNSEAHEDIEDSEEQQEPIEAARKLLGPGLLENFSPRRVKILGRESTVHIGPHIHIHHQKPEEEKKPRKQSKKVHSPFPKNSEKIARITDDIRFYYRTNLIILSPLPWVRLRTLELDDYFAELVIRQISNVGQESRARNEIDFKEIFADTATKLQNQVRTCILVEGSPGYGKTTLARTIAVDWGKKADYLSHFKLVVFIYCRDLKGRTLEKYVSETFPVTENGELRIDLRDWYHPSLRPYILFILDGLDECSQADAKLINDLLQGRIYAKSSILATSRPLADETTEIQLNHFTQKVSIKGFNRDRIERFIDAYFRERVGMSDQLKQRLFSHQAYQSLVTCPLLCQLFCLLFENDENLPDKVTDVYLRLIQCLIRRVKMNEGRQIPEDTLPPNCQEALQDFGKVCIETLVKDRFYITKDEILKILPGNMKNENENVIMGFLVKSNASISIFNKRECYQPLHKTFLEFVAAFYLKSLVLEGEFHRLEGELGKLQDMEYTSVEQVLLYTCEMLADQAYHILYKLGDIIDLKSTGNLKLLNASGCCDKNIDALTSVMDLNSVVVKSLLSEIDAWRNICTKSEVIKALKFQWDPRCDSLREEKVRGFFEGLQHNSSIEEIELTMFHGELKQRTDPRYEEEEDYLRQEVEQFGESIIRCMRKKNLKRFSVDLQIIQPSNHESNSSYVRTVVEKIVTVFQVMKAELSLEELKLNIDLGTEDLNRLVEAILPCRSLRRFYLLKICSEMDGFMSLAKLIRAGNLRKLEVSLNVTKYWRKMAGLLTETGKVVVGSPEMFVDPLDNLGREAFEKTLSTLGPSPTMDLGKVRNKARLMAKQIENMLGGPEVKVGIRAEVGGQEQEFHHVVLEGDVLGPLPLCNGHQGRGSGFHCLFSSLHEETCRLESFYLTHCLFSQQAEYFGCLGEVLVENKTLKKLQVQNNLPDPHESKVQYCFPLFLGLRSNNTLVELDLALLNVTVDTPVMRVFCHCLSTNTRLSKLDLSRWKFELELGPTLLESLQLFLSGTRLTQIRLEECSINLRRSGNLMTAQSVPALYCPLRTLRLRNSTFESLNICSLDIKIQGRGPLRARDIMQCLDFTHLKELDVSDPPRLPGLNTQSEELVVNDNKLVSFLQSLYTNTGSTLEVLKLVNWKVHLTSPTETLATVKTMLASLPSLTTLSLNNIDMVEDQSTNPAQPLLLKCLIKHLPNLQKLSLLRNCLTREQVPCVVRALKQKVGKRGMEIHTKHMKEDGLEELLARLAMSRVVSHQYNQQKGVLKVVRQVQDSRVLNSLKRVGSRASNIGRM